MEDSTWEDLEELRRCFPQVLAWGQAISQGRENVRITDDSDPGTARNDKEDDGLQMEGGKREDAFIKEKRVRRSNPKYKGHEWAV